MKKGIIILGITIGFILSFWWGLVSGRNSEICVSLCDPVVENQKILDDILLEK